MPQPSHQREEGPPLVEDEPEGSGSRAAAAGLITLMVILSVLLCPVAPVAWIWLASQLEQSSQPTLGPLVLILVGLVVTTILIGKLLATLGRAHARITGSTQMKRIRLPWLRNLRGERDSGRNTQVLDVVMVTSVTVALLVFGLWFFVFAGSSLPN